MSSQKHTLLLGAHMSIAGGVEQAIIRGESIGCTALQIFSKSMRQWYARKITEQESQLFIKTLENSTIKSVMVHASYLINLGSSNNDLYKKSIAGLIDELERCHQLNIPYLILHPGTHAGADEGATLERIAYGLDEAYAHFKGSTMTLLENMAGQGSVMCYSLEHLGAIRDLASCKKNIGICIDTCHAFAAGYDLRTPATYADFWQTFDRLIGIEHVKAFHINDSKKELGSRVDRHEEIGKGLIGLEAFRLLFNDPRFFDVPKVLETPHDDLSHYADNMTIIKGLISEKNHVLLGMD